MLFSPFVDHIVGRLGPQPGERGTVPLTLCFVESLFCESVSLIVTKDILVRWSPLPPDVAAFLLHDLHIIQAFLDILSVCRGTSGESLQGLLVVNIEQDVSVSRSSRPQFAEPFLDHVDFPMFDVAFIPDLALPPKEGPWSIRSGDFPAEP